MFYIIGGGAGIFYSKSFVKNYDDSNAKNSMALTTITYSNKSCKCENSDKSIIKKNDEPISAIGKIYWSIYFAKYKTRNICAAL
jgi:hypothetical protein